jgi:hypothetical protein
VTDWLAGWPAGRPKKGQNQKKIQKNCGEHNEQGRISGAFRLYGKDLYEIYLGIDPKRSAD